MPSRGICSAGATWQNRITTRLTKLTNRQSIATHAIRHFGVPLASCITKLTRWEGASPSSPIVGGTPPNSALIFSLWHCLADSCSIVTHWTLTAALYDLIHTSAKFGTIWVHCMNHAIIRFKMHLMRIKEQANWTLTTHIFDNDLSFYAKLTESQLQGKWPSEWTEWRHVSEPFFLTWPPQHSGSGATSSASSSAPVTTPVPQDVNNPYQYSQPPPAQSNNAAGGYPAAPPPPPPPPSTGVHHHQHPPSHPTPPPGPAPTLMGGPPPQSSPVHHPGMNHQYSLQLSSRRGPMVQLQLLAFSFPYIPHDY